VLDPKSETVLLTWRSGGHNGASLQFGLDGMLYISTGDAEVPSPPDPLNTGQDISDLLSSILRIDVDHEENGKAYAIPKDNPFPQNTEGHAGDLGLRLSQSMEDQLRPKRPPVVR
jgi:glucose/arabinose dehydrogenase